VEARSQRVVGIQELCNFSPFAASDEAAGMKSTNLRSSSRSTVADVIGKRISEKNLTAEKPQDADEDADDGGVLYHMGLANKEAALIHRGYFSWLSAFMMCIFVIGGFISLVLMLLALRNNTFRMVSEEISYIDAPNPPWELPPWGYVRQPGGASSRKIGQKFRYAMPQVMLFYSLLCGCFGLFTVAYFCSELLVQDIGAETVMQMGELVKKGVDVYLLRSMPVIFVVVVVVASVVWVTAGGPFVISMLVGASTCMFCANLGTNMNFEGGPRLTHAMNYDLPGSLQSGVRTGAIGGLTAHSLAQVGVVLVWMIVGDANALVGFGAGVSLISFYIRVGGGIFSKGSDIGADFVAEQITGGMDDDMNQDQINEMRKQLEDLDGDGEKDEKAIAIEKLINPDAKVDEMHDAGYVTAKELEIRKHIEEEMAKTLKTMHPVNYLDAIGENIADVGGTSSDLFETMSLTLATAVILGSKIHKVPYIGTSLPFAIISTGTLGCTAVCYKVRCFEKDTSRQIRRSLQCNLFAVILLVQGVVFGYSYIHWTIYHTISFDELVSYTVIIFLGLISPEVCASICEFFTSVSCYPVKWLAQDAYFGPMQVILQGLGQGFVSAGIPSVVNIIVQIVAFRLEGFYGLMLLACASQACTGWQATLAAYGAVANNALRMSHLTTVNELAHHRANVCAAVGTTQSHNGKVVSGQNAFFATTALLGALLADKRTKQGVDFTSTVGQELSEFARAGLLAGIIFTMLFLANTVTSCIRMAKKLVRFCKEKPQQSGPRLDKTFPATHIIPLKTLTGFAAIESFQLTFSPMCQTFAAPLVIGQLLGFKGLLMLVSGGNSVCFSLNMFLINSGQAWDAARKYVLFGMLEDKNGNVVGTDSQEYDTLGIGEQIGGPLEDLTGPALNNFIKFVAVVSFVTSDIYDEFPDNTWLWGIGQVFLNFGLIGFFKFGLAEAVRQLEGFLKRRREALEFEEGVAMLREIEKREKELAARMEGMKKDDQDLQLV